MKISSAVVVACMSLSFPAFADVTVADNNKTIEVDCAKDPQIHLTGNHITLTTKGVCDKIVLSGNHETVTASATAVAVLGNHNTVTLEAADEVGVLGNENTVVVRKAIKRKAPKIMNTGNKNKVR